jgi:PIN domain nuclease of toxin-antitoxin system
MAILLDTHALLWWMNGNPRLSPAARARIENESDVFVSAVSAVEIATKVRVGKLPEAARLAHRFRESVNEQGFTPLPISLEHGRLSGSLPNAHRDPFDRILAAQSLIEGMPLVTNDARLMAFGVAVVW